MGVMEQNRRNTILLGQDNNALTWLLIINAIVFVILNFVKIVFTFSDLSESDFVIQVLNWFSLPAEGNVFITRPWTLLTYMISHYSIWHLITSLLWLWGFGKILQDLTGSRKLVPIYLYGGLACGIVFLLIVNATANVNAAIVPGAPLLGAGACVMAVAVATTTLSPNYKLFPMLNGGIPLWVLTLVFVAIDFAAIKGSANAPAIFGGHIAAALVGFGFIRQLRRGNDWGAWMTSAAHYVNDLFNPEKGARRTKKQQHFYKASKKPFEKTPHVTQQRLDDILDKINLKGYNHLTEEEKDFLKKASKDI